MKDFEELSLIFIITPIELTGVIDENDGRVDFKAIIDN